MRMAPVAASRTAPLPPSQSGQTRGASQSRIERSQPAIRPVLALVTGSRLCWGAKPLLVPGDDVADGLARLYLEGDAAGIAELGPQV